MVALQMIFILIVPLHIHRLILQHLHYEQLDTSNLNGILKIIFRVRMLSQDQYITMGQLNYLDHGYLNTILIFQLLM